MFQIPDRSGLPSGALGAGAERFGFPSGVRGIPDVGWRSHCAKSETLVEIKIAKTKMDRATSASSCSKVILKSDKSCISNPKFRNIKLDPHVSQSPICDF